MSDVSVYAIEVEGLTKTYGEVRAVDGIRFQVEKGQVFGMLGPNGAGKSTTIEMLIGLRKPDAGKMSVLGFDPRRSSAQFKSLIGVQLQTPSLYPKLTVSEVVRLFGSLFPRTANPAGVIERVGLSEKAKTRVEALSGGQKHRLAIAIAMVNDGDLIFLDEPTTGLDPQARRNLWDVILEMKAAQKTVFLTTHFMDEAERLCDKLLIIDHGRIIAEGSPKELIDEHFCEKAVEFVRDGMFELTELSSIDGVSRVEADDARITLFTAEVAGVVGALVQAAQVKGKMPEGLFVRQATLEDVFLKLTGRRIRE